MEMGFLRWCPVRYRIGNNIYVDRIWTCAILRQQKLCDDKVVFSSPIDIPAAKKLENIKSIGHFKWLYKWLLTVQSSNFISNPVGPLHSMRASKSLTESYLDKSPSHHPITNDSNTTAILPVVCFSFFLHKKKSRRREEKKKWQFYISLFRKEWTRVNAVCSQSPPTDIFHKIVQRFCVAAVPIVSRCRCAHCDEEMSMMRLALARLFFFHL